MCFLFKLATMKHYTHLLFFILLFVFNYSKAQFSESEILIHYSDIIDVHNIDINDDNLLDIVVTSKTGIVIYECLAINQYVFKHKFPLKLGVSPNFYNGGSKDQTVIADINLDGNEDIIVGTDTAIYCVKNNGVMLEELTVLVDSFENLIDFKIMDVNNDNLNDVVALFNPNTLVTNIDCDLFFFIAESDGSYSSSIINTTMKDCNFVDIGDFDGDNLTDIIVVSESYTYYFYKNMGDGTYDLRPWYSSVLNLRNLRVYDMDSDGDLDLLFTIPNSNSSNVGYLENDGYANFFARYIINDSDLALQKDLESFDFNNDGHLDVATFKGIYINDGNMNFNNLIEYGNNNNQNNNTFLDFGDYDNDGNIELSFGKEIYNWNSIDLSFENSIAYQIKFYDADLKKRGSSDIYDIYTTSVFNNNSYDQIAVHKNNGDNKYTSIDEIVFSADFRKKIIDFKVCNLNSSDDYEIFVSFEQSDTILLYFEHDSSEFIIQSSLMEPQFIDVIDLNLDQKMDLVVFSEVDSKISYFLADNNGSFVDEIVLDAFVPDGYTEIADIDNDGDLDIVRIYFDNFDLQVNYFENLGNLSFSEEKQLVETSSISSILQFRPQLIDIDSDGDIDIITNTDQPISTNFHLNDGTGNFESINLDSLVEISLITDDKFRTQQFADIDKNGLPDIVIIAPYFIQSVSSIYIYYQMDTLSFSVPFLVTDNFSPSAQNNVQFIDFDNDEDLDLLYSQAGHLNQVIYAENMTSLTNYLISEVYFDFNKNGIRDINEPFIGNQKLTLEPSGEILITDEEILQSDLETGVYSISWMNDSAWIPTTDTIFDFTIPNTALSTISIGLYPKNPNSSLLSNITSTILRCNRNSRMSINVINTGTNTENGLLTVNIDSITNLLFTYPEYDTIINSSVGWYFNSLQPGSEFTTTCILEAPNETFTSDTLNFYSHAYISSDTSSLNIIDTFSSNYSTVVRCSYDPNDKKVNPTGVGEANYTLLNQWLLYTIRFQNVGNDTAFSVTIIDTIDNNLDITTFQVLNSSHNEQTSIQTDDRVIKFSYENILLPDSTTDSEGSNGFITYQIKPLNDISENSVIENSAAIYFDFNSPILTNTTMNTMVYVIPDYVSPTAKCKDIVIVELNQEGSATLDASLVDDGSTDNVGITSFVLSESIFNCEHIGMNAISLTIIDAVGNEDECTSQVMVVDSIEPTLVCKDDVTLSLNENGMVNFNASMLINSAEDNCDIDSILLSETSLDCDALGDNQINIVVTDGSMLQSECNVDINLLDEVAPTIECQDISINVETGNTTSITADSIVTAQDDNCSIAAITLSKSEFTTADVGSNEVTVSAIDNANNQTECMINVEVTLSTNLIETQYNIKTVFAPNPIRQKAQIRFSDVLPFSYDITIYNLAGERIANLQNLNQQNITLDFKNQANGNYIIHISASATGKILHSISAIKQ